MAKKKLPGHYCKICGERKSNEKFSGKGHTAHICKECDGLPQERKKELQILNRLASAAMKFPRTRQDWELLEKYAKSNKYPEAMEFARSVLEVNLNQSDIETTDDDIFDDGDIDNLPMFSEKKKFSELATYEKMLLRDYIHSQITEHLECSSKALSENDLIEVKKRMIVFFDEEQNIILKNDATLRQFLQANATNIISKLQEKQRVENKDI